MGWLSSRSGNRALTASQTTFADVGFERAHNHSSTGWGCVLPLGIKPETTPHPVDFPTYPRTL